MGKLLPTIKPHLYQNGGPIITVQVSSAGVFAFVVVHSACPSTWLSKEVKPSTLLYLVGRWRMNMAAILPVTTTTCVTSPSCSGLTSAMRWYSSPRMEPGLATWSVAQYKISMLLLTLGLVSVTCQCCATPSQYWCLIKGSVVLGCLKLAWNCAMRYISSIFFCDLSGHGLLVVLCVDLMSHFDLIFFLFFFFLW